MLTPTYPRNTSPLHLRANRQHPRRRPPAHAAPPPRILDILLLRRLALPALLGRLCTLALEQPDEPAAARRVCGQLRGLPAGVALSGARACAGA